MMAMFTSCHRTKTGIFRHKHGMRAAFRTVSFLALISIYCAYNFMNNSFTENVNGRRLTDETNIPSTDSNTRSLKGIFQDTADPTWLLAPYILGIIYMFLALAIVCDEYFVPALEVMCDENHLNLSMEIAGATLMAAGGSAPELFTSFIGTFQESDVGFGTIVGSAVFNVLFVIGCCAMFTKDELVLTWWPLFRDCTYYSIGLVVLAIFVGISGKGGVAWYEALILFLMYIVYVIIMANNGRLYKLVTGKTLKSEIERDEESRMGSDRTLGAHHTFSFRTGLLTMLVDSNNWIDKARAGLVVKVAGDVDEVFRFVDKDGNGEIDKNELKLCFDHLQDTDLSPEEVDNVFQVLDKDGDGKISQTEFKIWYIHSEENVNKRVKTIFHKYDSDNSGTIYKNELLTLIDEVAPTLSDEEKNQAVDQCFPDETPKTGITYDEFRQWYFNSSAYTKEQKVVETQPENTSIWEHIAPPKEATVFQYIKWAFFFPLVVTTAFTIPDSRKPGMEKWCYAAFLLSILWIGGYSYLMVGWAETVGATVGIPSYIMGLTFLAAGTSVPDLLSSVIVARMGEGDMAVSSSIGSNIFDILVGLPLPWLIYCWWPSKPSTVKIGTEGIWVSILILLAMLVLIILSIHLQGWKLTKTLGYIMFFLYFAFLLQAILREYL